ncbi:MAG: carbohydrate-binding domain-containing protein [Bacteroidales bacterium]|nr:carbohydrate-binding domain-containing protein [Bacteroidales bacterium]
MMRKKVITGVVLTLSALSLAWAAETMWIHRTDNTTLGLSIANADSVSLNGSDVVFTAANGVTKSMPNTEIEKVTLGEASSIVEIKYNGSDAEILNPFAFEGVEVTKNGADVIVTSTSTSEITYELTGTTTVGSLKVYSDKKIILNLNNASITNDDGAAINIQTGKKCTVNLIGTSTLIDAASYTTVSGEDQKGCFFSEGQLVFTGSGTLNVTGNYKHGICSDDYIDIQSGAVNIIKAANDGIRTNDYFLMTGGALTTAATGDGIDGDAGYIQIDGGTMNVTVSTADTKGIKCDSIITVNGGNITLTVPAAQGKGFKTKQSMTVNGGTITANMTGAVAIISNDPSYCSAIKADVDFVQTNGTINITHSGAGGKGISADGNVNLQGGTLSVTVTGGNGTYTNTSGVIDNYAPTCISADNNVNVSGGNVTLNVKANSAKGIKSDVNTTISGGTITGTLTGSSVVVNYDPSHCTLIKCDGNYTQNGGTINATHSGVGGKGISVDGVATFNSGNVTITTTGSAATYTASTGTDTYSPICISVDGNLNLLGGTFNVKSTGAGGKCIKSDQQIIMGTIDGVSPEITTPSVSSGNVQQVWNFSQTGGNSSNWVTTGSQGVEDIALSNGKLYAVCRGSSATDHTIKIINAYTGTQSGTLNTSSCTAGTYNLSSVETLGSTILACNLAANTSTNLVIYKWDSDSSAPTVLLNAAPPCTRAGDAMSVSGTMTNGRVWFAYGSQVYYYTISNGAIASTTPTTINLTKNGAAYAIASGVPYSNITVESDGSFWLSSSLANYAATHFSSTGAYIEEMPSGLVNNQGTDVKFFTYNGVKYAAASTYLNTSNTAIADGAVSIINMSTNALEGTYPSAGLGGTRNTCFRNSVCAEAGSDYYYVWINVPFQGAACYKYTEPTTNEESGSGEEESGSTSTTEIAPLIVTAETTGAQFGSSSSSGGPGGNRPGMPGSSTSSSSSTSPKVIKAMAAMTVYSGSFTIKSSNEGGEGLESKTTMTINGGNFYFNTYDDCLNAATALNINGGNLRCVATGNDAVDSNSKLSITGGLLLASGSRDPEEGIDVDQASQMSITGGTVINQKGNMLNLTTTQCKVPTIKYSSSISAGTLITITNSSGTHIMSFKAPQAMSQGCYITLPEFVSGSSYKLYSGGTVTGGTVFNEVTKGGSFSGGTQLKSFTISSNLTSI